MNLREKKSFCRFCSPCCGTRVLVDENDQLVEVRGDKEDLMTRGYACFKGLQAPAAHQAKDRILQPLKRQPDGSFAPIKLETALDEIAAKLRDTRERYGVEAIGGYRGGGAVLSASSSNMLTYWLQALGSPKNFSPITIDQSAKSISVGRLGIWLGGKHSLLTSDVRLFFGVNPLMSLSTSDFEPANPTKAMKEMRAKGMKLIVIDPRYTETAHYADIFLQPYPGEDPTIAAGLLHIILREGWEDKEFCATYVQDLELLRAALEPFTPDYVAHRAGINADDLFAAAKLFAHDCKRGGAASGTGPNMAPHSNLAEHLIETLNVVCGRYARAGEEVANPGIVNPRNPKAEVMPAPRWWEHGYKSRIGGYGMLGGEMMSGIFADEILQPGDGQLRCVIVHGSNVVNIMPDQLKTVRALKSLDLLVSIEPYMNETAKLSHYILPGTLQYERADLSQFMYEEVLVHKPWVRYTPPIAKPPAGAEVVDDWIILWKLAQRLGLELKVDGVPLDMKTMPSTDDIIAIIARRVPMPFEELKKHELGAMFDSQKYYVQPGDPNAGKFTTMPVDVAEELAEVAHEEFEPGISISNGERFTFKLTARRIRDVHNSSGRNIPAVRERNPFNPAYVNPDDLLALGIKSGDWIKIISDTGEIPAIVEADASMRRGVVSMTHAWGGLPGETIYERDGANTNLLISTDRDLDPINAMPRMTAIPINIVPVRGAGAQRGAAALTADA
jgi:anaerobic selenocysteine-containing dehydrogenase